MNYITFENKNDLDFFLQLLSVVSTSQSKDFLNCHALIFTKKFLKNVTTESLNDFVKNLINSIKNQLYSLNIKQNKTTFYLWFDEQVGHLCFNILFKRTKKLPFECRVVFVKDPLAIVTIMKKSKIVDGSIAIKDIIFDNQMSDENIDYVLPVYSVHL